MIGTRCCIAHHRPFPSGLARFVLGTDSFLSVDRCTGDELEEAVFFVNDALEELTHIAVDVHAQIYTPHFYQLEHLELSRVKHYVLKCLSGSLTTLVQLLEALPTDKTDLLPKFLYCI